VVEGEFVFPMGDEDDFAIGGPWSALDNDAEGCPLPSVMDWRWSSYAFHTSSQGDDSSTGINPQLLMITDPSQSSSFAQSYASTPDTDSTVDTSSSGNILGSQDGLGHDIEFCPV